MAATAPSAANEPASAPADSGPAHALAMHGEPALPPEFGHFPYARADAPQGGRLTLGVRGSFDSLNPYIVRGRSIWALRELMFESLMARSMDEPFALYGRLAERVETPPDRSSVTFTLHPEARFANGAPVTVEDVAWSMETLRDRGTPGFRNMYGQIARIETPGERQIRFVFEQPNRELPLLMGLMPVFSKTAEESRDFAAGGLEPPMASGPYIVAEMDPGRRLLLRKNPDYWGATLAANQGRDNFNEIEFLFFRDGSAVWEAFTAGKLSVYKDGDPAHWAEAYDFPAALDGRIQRAEIAHGRPSGWRGFVFNARRAPFEDREVRRALASAFDFEWLNDRFYRGGYERILSYFSGSSLGFDGPAQGVERALLEPFADALPPDTLETGWRPPKGAGDGRNRRNVRAAGRILDEAGWRIANGVRRNDQGAALSFEILVRDTEDERVAQAFAEMLTPLGVQAIVRSIDGAQYQERLNAFDYDMIVHGWFASLSPGEEQRQYWGSSLAETPGSRNYMGVQDPAIDAMIDALLEAETREAFEAAVRALDRVLASGVYVIPLGYLKSDLVAWRSDVARPETAPLYGHRSDVWWAQEP